MKRKFTINDMHIEATHLIYVNLGLRELLYAISIFIRKKKTSGILLNYDFFVIKNSFQFV